MSLFYADNTPDFSSEEWLKLSFGKALRELRRNEEMTMTQLATYSNISQSYISQLENGVRLPSDKLIEQISTALAKGVRVLSMTLPDAADFFNSINDSDDYLIKGENGEYTVYEWRHNYSDFEIESRKEDFIELFKKIKNNDESKQLQKELLKKVDPSQGQSMTNLSSDELELLMLYNLIEDDELKKVAINLIKSFVTNIVKKD